MPEPVSLISSADIKQEEFSTFLQQLGAVLHPDHVYDGRLSRGNFHIWIALDNSELKNFETDEIKRITQQLADMPQTHILLDVSKNPGSQQLAIEFACKFAEQWPCVVYDLCKNVYLAQDLLDLCRNGQGQCLVQGEPRLIIT